MTNFLTDPRRRTQDQSEQCNIRKVIACGLGRRLISRQAGSAIRSFVVSLMVPLIRMCIRKILNSILITNYLNRNKCKLRGGPYLQVLAGTDFKF